MCFTARWKEDAHMCAADCAESREVGRILFWIEQEVVTHQREALLQLPAGGLVWRQSTEW